VERLLLDAQGPNADVPFDRDEEGNLRFVLEAAHSAPRILHYADKSGMMITKCMQEAVAAHPLVTVMPESLVTDLLTAPGPGGEPTVVGAAVFSKPARATRSVLSPRGTVLASGGLAGIYQHSTNPPGFNALGSSAALALRAGARARDMEFVQFHPTALNIEGEARFLLSEALRGEGAVLRDDKGRPYVPARKGWGRGGGGGGGRGPAGSREPTPRGRGRERGRK
jgi:L-aspartate oxidase